MKPRNVEIDLTKGILTVGMVFAYTVQFLAENPNRLLIFISQLTNLVSFSGFLFCFGFAVWFADLQHPQRPWRKILRTVLKFYIAFLISGVAFRVLVNSATPGLPLLINIATLRDTPPYSEFLLGFAVVILRAAIFQRVIVSSTRSWQPLIATIAICLAFTLLPVEIPYIPLIAKTLGRQAFIAYPAIQYLPLFMLGVFRVRHPEQFNPRLYILAAITGVLLYIVLMLFNLAWRRYPPSAGWILCSTGIFFFYYWFAHIVRAKFPNLIQKYLNAVGQNVLAYLLLSNLVLFACHLFGLTKTLNSTQTFVIFVLLMGFIYFLQFIIVDLRRTNQSMNQED